MSRTRARIIETRSSIVKSSRFSGLIPTPTISSSNSATPRRMTSRWPFVIGSNCPGKTARRRCRVVMGKRVNDAAGKRKLQRALRLRQERQGAKDAKKGEYIELLSWRSWRLGVLGAKRRLESNCELRKDATHDRTQGTGSGSGDLRLDTS